MTTTGITQTQNTFKGFYRGRMHVSRVSNSRPGFSFERSNIFFSFHDLATGEILQTKPLRAYFSDNSLNMTRVEVNLMFKTHGYFVLEFHGLEIGDEISFISSF